MENISVGQLIGIISAISVLCSILGFIIGRKKDSVAQGNKEGTIVTDITYIKDNMTDIKVSIEKLNAKIDTNHEKTSNEYKELLVKITKLESQVLNLETRICSIEK